MSEIHARGRRRLPVWLWVVAGVLAVGLAATASLLLSNRGGGPVPEAEVITLPPPTPTVSAVERAPGSALYEALPSTVLAFALSASAQSPEMVAAGALEGYRMDYTDGSATLSVAAGQWPTPEEAQGVYTALATAASANAALPTATPTAAAGDESSAATEDESSESATAEPAEPVEEGAVEVDGAEVGRYTLVLHADGTATGLWTNGTVVLQADGPAAAVRDVYTAFPL